MKDLDIKNIWKGGDAADEKVYAQPEIDKMISKGSHSLVHRFIKTLTIELWVNLVILTTISLALFYSQQWVVGGGMMMINLLFFLYYKTLIGNLNKEEIDSSVLEYLYTIQCMIKKFILHYKIAALVLSVLIVAAIFYLEDSGLYALYSEKPKSFSIGMACGALAAVPITIYMIYLLYGKKAKKLAQMIGSLEKEEA